MKALGHEAHLALEPLRILPAGLRRVWQWFADLHGLREYVRLTEPVQMPNGQLGWRVKSTAMRIGPERIMAWAQLSQVGVIEPWQFATLQMIDEFYVRIKNDPPAPAVAATAENLLTMFRALGMKAKAK